ncbi:MAG: hypothetical protein CMB80_34370 [Flammeovirgaceae bacterium]|nr:hypothetical protein [Flammeovirgaceae bacterium]
MLGVILISSFSLTLQTGYKNYLCEDTKESSLLTHKPITICGKTCNYQYYNDQSVPCENASFTFNYNAPALYFEVLESCQPKLSYELVATMAVYQSNYSYLFANEVNEPPRFLS